MQGNLSFLQRNKQSACKGYAYSEPYPLPWLVLSFIILVTGCTPASRHFNQMITMTIPENTTPDYQLMACPQLWELHEKETTTSVKNTLYWLRIMSCSEQLNTLQARTLAETFQDLSWYSAFKRDILLNKAGPSVHERYTMVKHVDHYYHELPHTLLPVIKLWREQQVLQLLLIQEKARYQHLQLTADTQIFRLKEHETLLQHKLTNLTDIEHQLSARKQLQHGSTMAGVADSSIATTISLAEKNIPAQVQAHSSLSSDIK